MKKFLFLLFFSITLLWADRPVFSIKVGALKHFPPQYSLDTNGKPQGFAIDVFDALMKRMDGSWEYVIFDSWNEMLQALEEGKIDVIPNQGITDKRKDTSLFTAVLESVDVGMFVLSEQHVYESLSDLEGKEIGAVKNNVGVRLVPKVTDNQPRVYEDNAQMIFALLSKEIDGFIYPTLVTQKILNDLGLEERIIPLGAPLLSVQRAVGVGHHQEAFYHELQPVLVKFLQSAEFSAIYQKWYGVKNGFDAVDTQWIVSLLVLIGVVFIIFYYWTLKRNEATLSRIVELKTRALKDEVELHEKTETMLRQSEERFKLLFEKAPIAYQSLDEEGHLYAINEKWLQEMGYGTKNEVIGRWFGDFLEEDSRVLFSKAFEQFLQTGVIDGVELILLSKEGEAVTMEVTGQVYTPYETSRHLYCVLVNVTEVRAQEEMMLSQSRLAAMGEMMGMIAHQWRQPLAVMSMEINNIFADIELNTLNEQEVQTGLKKVTKQIMFLSQTIEDFRNFFQPNKVKIETSLEMIVSDALNIVGKSLENNGIEIIREGSLCERQPLYANELVQVLLNLLNNAKDALLETKPEHGWVKIEMMESLKAFSIIIEDNGGGIDETIIHRIFEPYVSTKSKNGTGLGLYMCKTIIEKHCGGTLTCDNTLKGATFTISLPKANEDTPLASLGS